MVLVNYEERAVTKDYVPHFTRNTPSLRRCVCRLDTKSELTPSFGIQHDGTGKDASNKADVQEKTKQAMTMGRW